MTSSPLATSFETARLSLRPQLATDFEESVTLWGDPIVTRHIGGRPFTREESWARLLRNMGHWVVLGYGYWVVREKDSGRFVGEVGLANLEREVDPPFDGAPEAGWVLAPWAHGRGFATEAAEGILTWADARFGGARVVCMIDGANAASIRVATKCGFREYARTTYKGGPVILFDCVSAVNGSARRRGEAAPPTLG